MQGDDTSNDRDSALYDVLSTCSRVMIAQTKSRGQSDASGAGRGGSLLVGNSYPQRPWHQLLDGAGAGAGVRANLRRGAAIRAATPGDPDHDKSAAVMEVEGILLEIGERCVYDSESSSLGRCLKHLLVLASADARFALSVAPSPGTETASRVAASMDRASASITAAMHVLEGA